MTESRNQNYETSNWWTGHLGLQWRCIWKILKTRTILHLLQHEIRAGNHQRPENRHKKSYVLYRVTKRSEQRISRGVQMLYHISSIQLLCSLHCAGDLSLLGHKITATVVSITCRKDYVLPWGKGHFGEYLFIV